MHQLTLGLGLGLVTVVPPGPIGLTLIGVATRQGRRPALRGAAGVAGGDLFAAVAALVVVAAGSTLPAPMFSAGQVVAALLLIGIGAAVLFSPSRCESAVERVRHPGRTLLAVTGLAPHALASWIALYAAMPFADDPRQLAKFGAGIVVASALWHPLLAVGSSALGARRGNRAPRSLSMLGGIATIAMGIVALAR